MDDSDGDAQAQEVAAQLRMSLHHFIERIVKAAAGDRTVAAGCVSVMATFVYEFTTKCVARDLIAFRDHAGRRTISEDDAILIARKTPFHDHLKRYLAEELGVESKDKAARKPRAASAALEQFKVTRAPRKQ